MVDRLAAQIRERGAPPELLERLQWTEPELRNFVARYQRRSHALRAAAHGSPLRPGQAQERDRARSIQIARAAGLGKGVRSLDGRGVEAHGKDDITQLFEGKKESVSIEYRDLVEAYYRSLVSSQ